MGLCLAALHRVTHNLFAFVGILFPKYMKFITVSSKRPSGGLELRNMALVVPLLATIARCGIGRHPDSGI